MILIVYTGTYREGSQQFAIVAENMAQEFFANGKKVIKQEVNSKKELLQVFSMIEGENQSIDKFHFIGHSGMYGPMFGTVQYPEQFSPFEIKNLSIPWSKNARAFFHCCRSGRWFAPFFALHQQVTTHGYHWYTSFSADKKYFRWPLLFGSKNLQVIGCIGRISHGLLGSLKKYSGFCPAEKFKVFVPENETIDRDYNKVAKLYDAVFHDIKVRKDEWHWLRKHLPTTPGKVLDIGCGNGALLKELAPEIVEGTGIDVSEKLLQKARKMTRDDRHIKFELVKGPFLPLDDHSYDLAISMLSFRYLDWDPLMQELKRVVKPEGKIIIVDMVTAPVKWKEYPKLLRSKAQNYWQKYKQPAYYSALAKLVSHPDWKRMLQYNPIRSQHEMVWYLQSRFPGRKVEVINVGLHARILAFDSGPIKHLQQINLTYP